jgi:NADH-quinone oxidoreductase subunit A
MDTAEVFFPVVAFAILFAASALLYAAMRIFRAGKREKGARGLGPYACGEDLPTHMIQPDYGQFYPFAFFFTILHVVALTATTVPSVKLSSPIIMIGCLYVVGALAGLTILYRK